MSIEFSIEYKTLWGEEIYVCGSLAELGEWSEDNALRLTCANDMIWKGCICDIVNIQFEYYYLVKYNGSVIRREWGKPRTLSIMLDRAYCLIDYWKDIPAQQFLYTSPFIESFFYHDKNNEVQYYSNTILIKVDCPFVAKGQKMILCGESDLLGNWDVKKSRELKMSSSYTWELSLDASLLTYPIEYKFAIYDDSTKQVIHWEESANRVLQPVIDTAKSNRVFVLNLKYNHSEIRWRAAGIAIPVFSLRSKDSFGVGEFTDLLKMVDWAEKTGLKVIQILPINDTTISRKWTDSYPYNAVSIYALHPIYLGLNRYPLKNKTKNNNYIKEAKALNMLEAIDYEKVLSLKTTYVKDLFGEIGKQTLSSADYEQFYSKNKEWLFPYACFSYLRDKFDTANYLYWKEFSCYDKDMLEGYLSSDMEMSYSVNLSYFTQYLLHIQLTEVRNYAHNKGVVLKGDIPIGISRESVDAWTDPILFNMDSQTGAPPDDFSVRGQNWGFPTYNWGEMQKDNYLWWRKRFRKMTDYFDAYRIDHILGFFRIWEIPNHSVFGLLGHFSPALPLTEDEIKGFGFFFDQNMVKPFIDNQVLDFYFGKYKEEVISTYLVRSDDYFILKDFCNTQHKIKMLLDEETELKNLKIKNGLYSLCEEVLFIIDKNEPSLYHPRINAQHTQCFERLNEDQKKAFNYLYNYFFYNRHNQCWKENALNKLPILINSTNMLVCGEDLGMIPDCVPDVMSQLEILSLEIQRMPKTYNTQFEDLSKLPYHSVCTTSTHDMSPVRLWWTENTDITQRFYNQVLNKVGAAPEACTSAICYDILDMHLTSDSMLVIFPLQDWLSISDILKHPEPNEERINIPSESQHYWRYRMHLYLEDLLDCDDFSVTVSEWLKKIGR